MLYVFNKHVVVKHQLIMLTLVLSLQLLRSVLPVQFNC